MKQLLQSVVQFGDELVVTRDGRPDVKTFEALNASIVLDPQQWLFTDAGRRFNIGLALWEFITLLTGSDDLVDYERFSPGFGKFSTSEEKFSGSYAPRVAPFIGDAIGKLKRHSNTRQAVVSIYSSDDMRNNWMDVRCSIAVQFLIREERLETIVTMRSSDAYLGFATDQAVFSLLAQYVANQVGVKTGRLFWNAASFHVYNYHLPKIAKLKATPNALYNAFISQEPVTKRQLSIFEEMLKGDFSRSGHAPFEFEDLAQAAAISSGGYGDPKNHALKTWAENFRNAGELW